MSGYVYRLISLAAAEALEKKSKGCFSPSREPPLPPVPTNSVETLRESDLRHCEKN